MLPVQEAGCEAALEYNGTMLDEQRIKVERCTSAGPRKSRQQRRDDKGPSSKARAPAPKVYCHCTGDAATVLLQLRPGLRRPHILFIGRITKRSSTVISS